MDLTDAAGWYDSREPGLGLEFLLEVHSAIARALKNPESFTRVRRNLPAHRVLIRRFPYRVFFIVRPDAIVVLPYFTQHVTTAFGSIVLNMNSV